LDDAPIYNPGHLFGFLSVFNPDVLDKADVIHGGFPAEFGGRLSSVLNIRSVSRLAERTSVSADIGILASRIKLAQPIAKDKASFWIAGRRSYVDKLVRNFTQKEVPYSFYDLNGKLIIHPSKWHQIEMSHYSGGDDLDFLRDIDGDGRGMHTTHHANNSSQTFKWSHRNPSQWASNLSMFHTVFGYNTQNAYKEDYRVSAHSEIEDFGAKLSIQKDSVWDNATISTGLEWIRHEINPKVLSSHGSISDLVESGRSASRTVQEYAAYVQQEWRPIPRITVNAGIRGSMAVTDSRRYVFPEPRVSARYALAEHRALKVSYSRMVQYLHRISNSAISTPIDVWFPVTDSIRPQTSHQFAMAWQRFVPAQKIYISVEGYYKSMEDLVSYEEGTNLLFKSDFASRLIQGRGKAYGSELLIRKETGKLTGWVSYSVSWSWRRFDELNAGEWFRARYDRRHNGAIVAQYQLNKRWMASLVWEYISGSRFTPVVGQHLALAPNGTGLELIPVFSDINSVKLTDSHRLDLGMKLYSRPGVKVKWNLFVGVYNVYNRATPFGIVIKQNKEDKSMSYSQPGLFGLLPFISWGVKI
jgi:outer membrane receptor protein involved in Fe transport